MSSGRIIPRTPKAVVWLLAGTLLLFATRAVFAGNFFVAPDGNDANAGTADKPFATLEHARDAVRAVLARDKTHDVVVTIHGGTYALSRAVAFSLTDSPAENQRVIYQAATNESPLFTSAFPICGWRKLETLPPGFPAVAAGHLWIADVPKHPGTHGAWNFKTLYAGDKRLLRARGPGFAPTLRLKGGRMGDQDNFETLDQLNFPKGALRNWPNLADIEVLINPTHQWLVNYLPLKSVDEATGVATTALPGTYALAQVRHGAGYVPESVWVENVPEGLNQPGEWTLDSRAGNIYFWPESEAQLETVRAPALTELVRVEGANDINGTNDIPVRNLTFRGLTFCEGDRDTWTTNSIGLQHDWDMFDAPNALVRFRGAEGCVVDGCKFFRTGATALRLDLFAQHNTVENCCFSDIGLTGILLAGYGPGTKDVNHHNRIMNNIIERTGQMYLHGIGLFVWQSGSNEIAHNHIHHTPYACLVVSGVRGREFDTIANGDNLFNLEGGFHLPRDRRELQRTIRWNEIGTPRHFQDLFPFLHARGNQIVDNELNNGAQQLGDGNVAYFSATGLGNVFRRNLLYNCETTFRCDDDEFGMIITENLNLGDGGFRVKHVNMVVNNIALAPHGPAIMFGEITGQDFAVAAEAGINAVVGTNILVAERLDLTLMHKGPTKAKMIVVARDNLLSAKLPAKQKEGPGLRALRESGRDLGHIVGDPEFVDAAKYDFRLKADSPALKLGFHVIDAEGIGLLNAPALVRIRREGMPPETKNYWNTKPERWFLPATDAGETAKNK
jgi:Right handed beta helix region